MAFVWTAISIGDKFTAAHYNQIQTNTDQLASDLGIAEYAWTIFPVTAETKIFDLDDTEELRDALDYIFDNNTCVSNNANADTAVDNDQHATYNGSANSPVNSSQNTGVK